MTAKVYWQSSIDSLIGNIRNISAKAAENIGREIFSSVTTNSPVRTGSFRASWRMTIGHADTSVTDGGDPSAPLSPPGMPSISLKPGQSLYISNSQPYAYRLEHGWSDQAPSGMLRIAIQSLGGMGYV